MPNLNQCNFPCTGEPQSAVYDRLQQASNVQLAVASSERSADITIVTDDDDKVTLSLDSRVQAVALTYEETARSGSSYSESHAELVGIDVERQIELDIQGELNEQERKEIKQVLKAIFKMVKNFLAGKFGTGVEEAQEFAGLETISSVKAEFEARDSAAYVSRSVARDLARVQAPAANAESAEAPVSALADRMVAVVKKSGVDPAKVQKPVDELFGQLMRRFLEDGPFGFRKMRRLRAIMQEFSRNIDLLRSVEKSETVALQPLNSEALEQVAPTEMLTVEKSTRQTQVSVSEYSAFFSFGYSAGNPEETTEEEVSVAA